MDSPQFNTFPYGFRKPVDRSKIKTEIRNNIRQDKADGMKYQDLADKYNKSTSTIYRIVHERT